MKSISLSSPRLKISAKDRLIFTLFMSILLNVAIILGIGFEMPDFANKQAEFPTIDVTLVDVREPSPEDSDANLLAQANQQGAGNTEIPSRPSTMQSAAPLPAPVSGDAELLRPNRSPTDKPQPKQHDVLTSYASDERILNAEESAEEVSTQHSAAELVAIGHEMARLNAEINRSMAVYSNRPKHRFIAANTKAYRDAAYLDGWRRKIERIGNLNYPEEARRRKLSGHLIMDVAIRQDGTIDKIDILRSSGHKLLDDAAKRIVRLASPFAPLSPEMQKDTDILHITRSWQFLSDNRLSTR